MCKYERNIGKEKQKKPKNYNVDKNLNYEYEKNFRPALVSVDTSKLS